MNSTTNRDITVLLCDIDTACGAHTKQSINGLCAQAVLPHQILYISNRSEHQHKQLVAELKKKTQHNVQIKHALVHNPSNLLALAYALQLCKTRYLFAINSNCILHEDCIEQLTMHTVKNNHKNVAINIELSIDDNVPHWIEPWLHQSMQFQRNTQSIYRYVVGMLYAVPPARAHSQHNSTRAYRVLSNIADSTQPVESPHQPPLLSYRPSNADMLPYHIFNAAVYNGYAAEVISHQSPSNGAEKYTPSHDMSAVAPMIDKIDSIISCMQDDATHTQQSELHYGAIDPIAIEQLRIHYFQLGRMLAHCYPAHSRIKTIQQYTQHVPLSQSAHAERQDMRDMAVPNRYLTLPHHLTIDKYIRYHLLRHRYISVVRWFIAVVRRILKILLSIKQN